MNSIKTSKYFIRNGELYKSCPECTVNANREIYYKCPEYFGYRKEHYSQSLCNKCRGKNKKGPYSGFVCRGKKESIIPEIRLLPMGKEEFLTMRKTKTEAGNVVYKLPPSERQLKDDRSFCLAACGFFLSELRRKDKFNIEVPKQDFSVMFSNPTENKKQQANPFAGRKNPFLGRNPFRR